MSKPRNNFIHFSLCSAFSHCFVQKQRIDFCKGHLIYFFVFHLIIVFYTFAKIGKVLDIQPFLFQIIDNASFPATLSYSPTY